jgi:hypothetical protein
MNMNRRQRRAAAARARSGTGYLDRVMAASAGLEPAVYEVTVLHEDACGFHRTGVCTCRPIIHRRRYGGHVVETIGLDGETTSEPMQ